MDVVDRNTRSRMMAGIRRTHTKPEILVRRVLFSAGFRYRLHRRDLPGSPDVVLPGRRVAVFVHGCFWHQHPQCKFAKLPTSRPEFWAKKLARNMERDEHAVDLLLLDGWRVLTVWECATRDPITLSSLEKILSNWILGKDSRGEVRGFEHPQGS